MRAVNLLPERRRLSACIRNRIVIFSAGVPIFLLANLIGWLVGSSLLSADLGAGHAEIAMIRQQIEDTNTERGTLIATHSTLRSERSAREALAARPVWAALLRRIAIVSVDHGRLDRITVRPLGSQRGRANASSDTPPPVGFDITMGGQAHDAGALTELLLQLEDIGVFDQVSLLTSARVREDNSDASVRFEIRCSIVGGQP